ncbi:hypothetical protein [Hymenobacter latericus]|uniref:hypothetical protein n=1 Tax=Hymenobacter sp. YIM 151858-1 TaxID=2987688 RepID=UPI002226B6FF|nr:hypothetical protein [Hymenobacter sp. YIM 151858-1]UYZ60159.1 hypothetical protein OIS50_04990 [Hymenobacter sp. YIM 151858-1]
MPVLKLLKIDPLRCYNAKTWADKKKVSERTVYRGIEDKSLPLVEIAGQYFVYDLQGENK